MVRRTIDDKKEILKNIIINDKCKIDLDKITELRRDTKIEFECNCGTIFSKSFVCFYNFGGGFCKAHHFSGRNQFHDLLCNFSFNF